MVVAIAVTLMFLDATPGLGQEEWPAEIIMMASQLAEDLKEARKRFEEERKKIETAAATRQEVLDLIDDTQIDLDRAVDRADRRAATLDLDPMRDWVREKFSRIRAGLEAAEGKAALPRLPGRRPLAVVTSLASFIAAAAPAASDVYGSSWTTVLDDVSTVIDVLYRLAVQNDLVIELCVASIPDGAYFKLFRKGEEDDPRHERPTNGMLSKVVRGIYDYRVEHSDYPPIKKTVNLVDDKGPICCLLEKGVCYPPSKEDSCGWRKLWKRCAR